MRYVDPLKAALLFALALALLLLALPGQCLDLEGGVVVGLWPDAGIDIGPRVGLEVFVWPDKTPLIGGNKQFVDFLYVAGQPAGGLCVSLRKAADDDGTRIGVAAWQDAGGRKLDWDIYAAYGVQLDLEFLHK